METKWIKGYKITLNNDKKLESLKVFVYASVVVWKKYFDNKKEL